MKKSQKNLYDLIIVGSGPAGLSAAIYAGRARLKTLVIDPSEVGGQIRITNEIVNYPGIISTTGADISETMETQARSFGAEFLNAMVEDVIFGADLKTVKTSLGKFRAVSVILATGTKYRALGFEGEKKYLGRGVAYCATCDGEFFTNMHVFVIGAGFAAADEAIFLTRYAKSVTVIAREPAFTCSKSIAEKVISHPKIEVHFNTEIETLEGDDLPRKATFMNNISGEKWTYENEKSFGVFVFIGYLPQTQIFDGKINLNQYGYIQVDEKLQSSKEGIFAAGDVISKDLRQLVTAVSDGAIASTNAEKYIEIKKEELKLVINSQQKEEDADESLEESQPKEEVAKAISFFDEELVLQVKPILDRFEKAVNLVLIKTGDDRLSKEMEAFLTDMSAISSKVNLDIYNQDDDIETQKIIDAKFYPVIAIFNQDNEFVGIKYNAVPSGHEFNSFILALYNIAGPGQEISYETKEKISQIKSLDVQIGISLSCTMCPDVVQAAQIIALYNKNIDVEFIDITKFPEFKSRHNIMSVPATVINEEKVIFGKKSLDELIGEFAKV